VADAVAVAVGRGGAVAVAVTVALAVAVGFWSQSPLPWLLRLATTAGIKVAVEMRVSYDAPEWIFISTARAVVRIFPSRNEEQKCL
jgi:hypothetical protein